MNNLQQTNNKMTVSGMTTFLTSDAVKNKINQICGKKEGDKLISNLVSNVQQNPTLAECSQGSIVSAALAGHALKLDFALQQAYMIPFNNKRKGCKEAQFCIGWKGYVQLAERSGQYQKINVMEVKEGELEDYDPLEEDYIFHWNKDKKARASLPTIGYVAYIKLMNGFVKKIYWTKDEMLIHAEKYSSAYQNDLKYKGKSSFWNKDFDSQAKKTMLRQIISKFGVMSTDMKTAIQQDMAVLDENGNVDYVDNQKDILEEAEVIEEQEPTINDEQIQTLCETIVKHNMNVMDFMKEKGIENVNTVTITEYNKYMKELGATNE